jgi:hypothetical protein
VQRRGCMVPVMLIHRRLNGRRVVHEALGRITHMFLSSRSSLIRKKFDSEVPNFWLRK